MDILFLIRCLYNKQLSHNVVKEFIVLGDAKYFWIQQSFIFLSTSHAVCLDSWRRLASSDTFGENLQTPSGHSFLGSSPSGFANSTQLQTLLLPYRCQDLLCLSRVDRTLRELFICTTSENTEEMFLGCNYAPYQYLSVSRDRIL